MPRMSVSVSDETAEKIEYWSKKLAINKSQVMNISIISGLDTFTKMFSPQSLLSADQWVDIIETMQKRGIEVNELEAFKNE